jgi:hypothetical protein
VLQLPADAALASRVGQAGIQEKVHDMTFAASDSITRFDQVSLKVVVFSK